MKDEFLKKFRKILNNELAVKIIGNSSWLIGDKVFTMMLGVFVTAMVARYFGPEKYGVYNYALSFVTLFTAFSTLGLETLAVKSIVDKDYDEGTVLFTSFLMRVVGGVLLTFLSAVIIRIIEPNDKTLHILVLVMSTTMVFKAFEVIEFWIQAYQKAKISSIIRMTSYILIAALKILIVILGGDLIHYSLVYTLNTIIVGVALIIAYVKNKSSELNWNFDFAFAKYILSQSWYLILSGLMVTLYMQIDKIMLGTLMNTKTEVGVYSAATQIAQLWYFVPMAIITSFKPVIMKNKGLSNITYEKSVQMLYSIIVLISLAFGIIIFLFSDMIVGILYGQEFIEASKILSISVWAGTFAVLGSARGVWLICEGLQKYSVIYISLGAIANIFMNLILIPQIGFYGAAIATLISQILVAIIAPALFKKTRTSSLMILRAFKLKGLIK
ncbi:flippase [Senegalia massiliensis]|uniref:Flippase n=1 Tax=Senegalia massiliensis TaxID=1720316 RepID=A0A845QVW5_9CLOT|nr:flippase [Senegalia massiliensis]NBI07067.1 flippase [Senegalia massiliensis]